MDSFSEQIVKQTLDGKRILLIFAAVLAAVIVCAATLVFLPALFVPILALCGFGIYWVASSQSWEVEYAVTNGDIDIDRIVARRSRTCIVRVRGEKIEHLLPVDSPIALAKYDRTVMAARSKSTATWVFTYQGKSGSTIVFFEPSDEVLASLKSGLSRLVQIETDRAMREL